MIRPKRLHLTEGDHPRKFDSITQKRNYDWMVHKLVGICVENLESVNQIFVNFCSCLLPCITDNRLLPLASKNNSKIDIMAGNTNITGYGIFRLTDVSFTEKSTVLDTKFSNIRSRIEEQEIKFITRIL